MSQYIQNVVFDGAYQEPYFADEDIVGYEVRKKSIASNLWECLTGKKPKSEIYLFEEPPRQELVLYDSRPQQNLVVLRQEYYNDDLPLMPWRPQHRYYMPQHYHSEYHERTIECDGCPICLQCPDLGRYHRPFPRLGRSTWRYDYNHHEHGHGYGQHNGRRPRWDPAPFWDPNWVPRRWRSRLSHRARSERRQNEHPGQTLQREFIKLMNQRLQEMRHERIYNEWPRGTSVDTRRRRNDRIEEIDEQLVDLNRMQYEAYFGSDDGSTDYDFSGSDD